jgi:hypothetical protein
MGSGRITRGVVTLLDPLSKAFLFAAAALAWLVARRQREHWPVAAALSLALLLDAVRALVPLSFDDDKALYLAHPALSVWCVGMVAGCPVILTALVSGGLWAQFHKMTGGAIGVASVMWQTLFLLLLWLATSAPRITVMCVVILAAGDAAALVGSSFGGPWWPVQGQALLVSLLLGLIQMAALRQPDTTHSTD